MKYYFTFGSNETQPFPFVRKLKLLQKEEDEQLQREQEQFFRVGNESELTQLILC